MIIYYADIIRKIQELEEENEELRLKLLALENQYDELSKKYLEFRYNYVY